MSSPARCLVTYVYSHNNSSCPFTFSGSLVRMHPPSYTYKQSSRKCLFILLTWEFFFFCIVVQSICCLWENAVKKRSILFVLLSLFVFIIIIIIFFKLVALSYYSMSKVSLSTAFLLFFGLFLISFVYPGILLFSYIRPKKKKEISVYVEVVQRPLSLFDNRWWEKRKQLNVSILRSSFKALVVKVVVAPFLYDLWLHQRKVIFNATASSLLPLFCCFHI